MKYISFRSKIRLDISFVSSDSHETSSLIWFIKTETKIERVPLLQILDGNLMVNSQYCKRKVKPLASFAWKYKANTRVVYIWKCIIWASLRKCPFWQEQWFCRVGCIIFRYGACISHTDVCGYMWHTCLPNASQSHVICLIQSCYQSASSRVIETLQWPDHVQIFFKNVFSVENIIIVSLNTVIPIIVMVWLSKVTWCLGSIIYSHSLLATF